MNAASKAVRDLLRFHSPGGQQSRAISRQLGAREESRAAGVSRMQGERRPRRSAAAPAALTMRRPAASTAAAASAGIHGFAPQALTCTGASCLSLSQPPPLPSPRRGLHVAAMAWPLRLCKCKAPAFTPVADPIAGPMLRAERPPVPLLAVPALTDGRGVTRRTERMELNYSIWRRDE